MKQLLDMLTGDENKSNLSDIMNKFGLDESQAREAVGSLLPGVSQGIQKQVQAENSSILDNISSGGSQQYIDDDNASLSDDSAMAEGNSILSQIFDNEEDGQQIAGLASEKTGLDSGILQQMMPMIASMAMGGIGKQVSSLGIQGQGNSGIMSMVGSMIDTDGDGIDMDDIKNIAGKFFG